MGLVAREFSKIDDQYLQDLFISRACVISGYAIFIYELFEVFPDEVEYIWPTRWSTVKILYLLNRYGNLIFLTIGMLQNMGQWRSDAPLFCYESSLGISLVQLASFSSVHILVLLRAWATWGRHIKILILLVILFMAYAIVSGVLSIYAVVSVGPHSYPFSDVIGTCLTPIPSRTWVVFLPSLVLEFAIFALTMFSLRQYHFDYSMARRSPIVWIIARDGIIYFLVSVFNSVVNMLVWAYLGDRPLNMLATSFTLTVVIVAAQRLVLDLRKVSTSDDLSTTRVGREVDRAIGALPRSRPRSPSPLVFAEERLGQENAGEPRWSYPRRIDVGNVTSVSVWPRRQQWPSSDRDESDADADADTDTAVLEMVTLKSPRSSQSRFEEGKSTQHGEG